MLYISQTMATQTECMPYVGVGTVVPCIDKSMTCEWDYLNSMNVLHSQSMMHRSAIGVMVTCSAYRVYTHTHTHTHARTHTYKTDCQFCGRDNVHTWAAVHHPSWLHKGFLWVCSFNDALLL